MLRNAFLIVAVMLIASSGSTDAGEISVRLGGTAFNGGPAFRVTLGGTLVGEGVVSQADGQDFSFAVDDDILSLNRDLRIALTNDAFAEGQGDRNLQVISARVGNATVTAVNFGVYRIGHADAIDTGSGLLFGNNDYAVASAPATGWLDRDRSVKRPKADAPVGAAAAVPAAPSSALCDAKAEIINFPIGTSEVPEEDASLGLADVLLQAHGDCAITITGYASAGGGLEVNESISQQRAEAVLQFLLGKGAEFSASQVIGFGPTSQFGAPDQNRRVIITMGN